MRKTLFVKATVLLAVSALPVAGEPMSKKMVGLEASQPAPGLNELSGKVVDENGAPLGDAYVRIASAKPAVGPQYMCPSCYLDCSKSAKTAGDGRFTLASLNRDLIFQVLVLKSGFVPKAFTDLKPGRTDVQLRISRMNLDGVKDDELLGVRVRDAQGRPVPGAAVSIEAENWRGEVRFGRLKGQTTALSDAEGLAVFADHEPEKGYDVLVISDLFAPKYERNLHTGSVVQPITLTNGAFLSGTVQRAAPGGRTTPVPGAIVGAIGPLDADGFIPVQYAYADRDGRYVFANLPPERKHHVFVVCNGVEAQAHSACPAKVMPEMSEGERKTDMDFVLREGKTVRGKLVFPQGVSAPEGSRVSASIRDTWDSVSCIVQRDGTFELQGLPDTDTEIWIHVSGYVPAGQPVAYGRQAAPIKVGPGEDAARIRIEMREAPARSASSQPGPK